IDNHAFGVGGGIATEAGDVTFKKWTTFGVNTTDNGAAFAVLGGTLTFQAPNVVTRFTGNTVVGNMCPAGASGPPCHCSATRLICATPDGRKLHGRVCGR
ncbi:unnamed protein product, partial [Ectocarpus sp. 4 AP-2014]